MGRRGPPPDPVRLRILKGEKRASRLQEPQPREAEPEPPKWLSAPAREVWDYTCDELRAMELLKAADRDVIVVYVNAVADFARAQRMLDETSLVLRGRHGQLVRSPLNAVARDKAALVRVLARELGLTPAGRVSLGQVGAVFDSVSAADRLLS